GDHQVRRLDVAVDDALLVGAAETEGGLGDEARRLGRGQGTLLELRRQGLAVVVGHDDEELAFLGLVDLEDGAGVRVVERRGRARLLEETLVGLDRRADVRRQELERHLAAELDVLRLVDDAHAAPAEALENLVVGNDAADHGRRSRLLSPARTSGIRTIPDPAALLKERPGTASPARLKLLLDRRS